MFGIAIPPLKLLLILIGIILWLIAVIKLKNNALDNISKVLWAAFFTWTPIAGPICFLIVNSKKENSE